MGRKEEIRAIMVESLVVVLGIALSASERKQRLDERKVAQLWSVARLA